MAPTTPARNRQTTAASSKQGSQAARARAAGHKPCPERSRREQINVQRTVRSRISHEKQSLAKPTPLGSGADLRKTAPAQAGPNGKSAEKGALLPAPVSADTATKPLNLSQEKTLTLKEAAFRLGKTPDAIRRWLITGRLRGWQPGGRGCSILVLESSVEEALLCSFGSG